MVPKTVTSVSVQFFATNDRTVIIDKAMDVNINGRNGQKEPGAAKNKLLMQHKEGEAVE